MQCVFNGIQNLKSSLYTVYNRFNNNQVDHDITSGFTYKKFFSAEQITLQLEKVGGK